jgi:peptidoglycan/xylan/chitin deacetylase (PgdA/CDA1 family)
MSGDARPPAVMHVDLDGARAIYAVHGWPAGFDGDPLFETGLRNALDFFERHEITATLFVIAQDLDDPAKRALIDEAVGRGHEIGSHSTTHRRLTELSPDERRTEIAGSRRLLQGALGVPVRGFRAPEFDLDADCLRLVEEAGYAFDASLFPNAAFERRMGGRRPAVGPHRPHADGPLVELTMPSHAPLPFPFHPSYSLVLGRWYFRLGLGRYRRTGAPLVLLFHLTDFADPVPDRFLLGWRSRLFTLSHLGAAAKRERCARMLELVARHYELMSTAALLDQCGEAVESANQVGT